MRKKILGLIMLYLLSDACRAAMPPRISNYPIFDARASVTRRKSAAH